MSKHTEGPWRITGGMAGTGGRLIEAHPGTGCCFDVARVELPPFGPDRDAARDANARLIAAAPTMLDALERIAAMERLPIGDQSEEMSSRLEAARVACAALAKARGEQE
jgi:hypothetical protein